MKVEHDVQKYRYEPKFSPVNATPPPDAINKRTKKEQLEIKLHTLIIGAGPAGLAAAYELGKQGITSVVIEKDNTAGGLMRSLKRGNFVMDVGRKELYTRLPKVDALWKEILKDGYVTYEHREGILYKGRILESNSKWLGFRRGMSWGMLGACGADFIWSKIASLYCCPRNYEDYWYGRRGKRLSQILSQRYEEKFKGVNWRDMPPCEEVAAISSAKESKPDPLHSVNLKERREKIWRHPAKGSGQICENLEEQVRAAGSSLRFGANIKKISVSGNHIETVTVAVGEEEVIYRPLHVISSVPAQIMARLLGHEPAMKTETEKKPDNTPNHDMSTVCVYLFLNEPPRFPHAWLKVTCPDLKIGRITNFSAFNGQMVPKGMACLCVEFFCPESDPLLSLSNEELLACVTEECSRANLIDREKCVDHLVLKLPGTNAATNWRDWNNPKQLELLAFLNSFDNLYYVNRPGTDKATYAGLEAASAIIANDRQVFFDEMALSIPCWNKGGALA